MFYERLSRLPPGYKKQRHSVRLNELPQWQFPAHRLCAGCTTAIGLDRTYVRHYGWYHLECWQKAFPDLAAEDSKTRGES